MIERKSVVVHKENGVKLSRNVYVDKKREYTNSAGKKKKAILDEYSEASQRNILMNALVSISNELNIDNEHITALKELKTFIDSI